ncbi:nucleoside-diphosphate kinase [Chloroflexota bacterium]
MEKTLVLVKPDAVTEGLSGDIISRLERLEGIKLVAARMLHMDEALAGRHYAVHKDKPFYAGLIKYITSAPIVALVLQGENVVEKARQAMGATDPSKAAPGTIRADFGHDIEHNAVHGSDAVDTAVKEIELFFAGDEIFG